MQNYSLLYNGWKVSNFSKSTPVHTRIGIYPQTHTHTHMHVYMHTEETKTGASQAPDVVCHVRI